MRRPDQTRRRKTGRLRPVFPRGILSIALPSREQRNKACYRLPVMPSCLQACAFVQGPFVIIPCPLRNGPFENPFKCPRISSIFFQPLVTVILCPGRCLAKHASLSMCLLKYTEPSLVKGSFHSQSFMDILRGSGQRDCDLKKECHSPGISQMRQQDQSPHCVSLSSRIWVMLGFCGPCQHLSSLWG